MERVREEKRGEGSRREQTRGMERRGEERSREEGREEAKRGVARSGEEKRVLERSGAKRRTDRCRREWSHRFRRISPRGCAGGWVCRASVRIVFYVEFVNG